ncbi:hypothetical protein D9M68_906750 [compost metagenome]
MAHLGGTARHRIEHFQCRHQLAGGVHLDLQAAVTHLLDQLGEAFGAHAYAREILRPGGNHLPVESLATRTFLGFGGSFSLFVATGQGSGCKTYTRSCENLTTLHVITPCFVVVLMV